MMPELIDVTPDDPKPRGFLRFACCEHCFCASAGSVLNDHDSPCDQECNDPEPGGATSAWEHNYGI